MKIRMNIKNSSETTIKMIFSSVFLKYIKNFVFIEWVRWKEKERCGESGLGVQLAHPRLRLTVSHDDVDFLRRDCVPRWWNEKKTSLKSHVRIWSKRVCDAFEIKIKMLKCVCFWFEWNLFLFWYFLSLIFFWENWINIFLENWINFLKS